MVNYPLFLKTILRIILKAISEVSKSEINLEEFTFHVAKDAPQQNNSKDCGVYICNFLDFYIDKNSEIFNYESSYKRYKINSILEPITPRRSLRTKNVKSFLDKDKFMPILNKMNDLNSFGIDKYDKYNTDLSFDDLI